MPDYKTDLDRFLDDLELLNRDAEAVEKRAQERKLLEDKICSVFPDWRGDRASKKMVVLGAMVADLVKQKRAEESN